jgi:predicted metal-dependent hydrolase
METELLVHGLEMPVLCRWNDRARRYSLTLDGQGRPRVTIPRRGQIAEARRFVTKQIRWIQMQLAKHHALRQQQEAWSVGNAVLFRGELAPVELREAAGRRLIQFGAELVAVPTRVADDPASLRALVMRHLRGLALAELPGRVAELAALHGCVVTRVTVRDQRTRWGSCSTTGGISLNWRLVQTPVFVRDYIILHELMHLREMNHSKRFWDRLAGVCPGYRDAKSWLRANVGVLGASEC